MSDENSEWFVEVVRIVSVEKHPGADRLELVRFATKDGVTAYTVVDRAGTWKPGDTAVYCAVDSLLPLDAERWAFLRPKDYVVGSGKKHRLKAARLRGVYSEGILTACPVDPNWDIVDMGITKYEAPEVGSPFTAPGEKRLLDGTLGGKFPIYRIQNLKKAPHYFEEGEEVIVTEKIHGTNARYMWEPGRGLTVGSHRVVKSRGKTVAEYLFGWLKRLWRREKPVSGGYYGEDLWSRVAETYALRGMYTAPNVVLYGEIYGANIQDLNYGCAEPRLRVFDAYDSDSGEWLSYEQLAILAADYDVNMAPVLYRGPYSQAKIAELAEGDTVLGPENGFPSGDTCIPARHIREGVVVRTPGRNAKVAKWVGEGYKMRKGG